jgi:hypothetical protein
MAPAGLVSGGDPGGVSAEAGLLRFQELVRGVLSRLGYAFSDGKLLDDTWVADITGLLDLSERTGKVPGLRILAGDEPLHPKYMKRATWRVGYCS